MVFMNRIFIIFFSFFFTFVFAGDVGQPYLQVSYPTFENGRLYSVVEAEEAEAYDITSNLPRVNLINVKITLYDHSSEALSRTPDDQALPIKMIITSDRGSFVRSTADATSGLVEEIAHLEENVLLRRFRTDLSPSTSLSNPSSRRLASNVETEIRCNHAQWNNSLRKLNGDGAVEFLQEDSKITGVGFLYLADEVFSDSSSDDKGGLDVKNWGGIIYIEHDARMEIERAAFGDNLTPGKTIITCKDTASYKLNEQEIQFEREVKVRRPGLSIDSDILKVFLRKSDDPLPPGVDSNTHSAGTVRSIIATIGRRPGAVVITGYDTTSSEESIQYIAKGGRADFDYDLNRIVLTDSRPDRIPEIEFGRDRISDRILEFDFFSLSPSSSQSQRSSLKELRGSGGRGYTLIQAREGSTSANFSTEIRYSGTLVFNYLSNQVKFTNNVILKREDLEINSEILDITLSSSDSFNSFLGNLSGISKIVAENSVYITTSGREAKAERAEYDVTDLQGRSIDILRLYANSTNTPPYPWVRDSSGNQISAPVITMQRLQLVKQGISKHLIQASGGVIICDFITSTDSLGRSKVVAIRCEDGLEYDELKRKAIFSGKVMATSDVPEDNYVLTSDNLEIYLLEEPTGEGSSSTLRPRRIDASGNARFLQDHRSCEAKQIIRDFPVSNLDEGDIYLSGVESSSTSAAIPAIYYEKQGDELGAKFTAPLIKAAADGTLIQASGPGELSVPDEVPNSRVEIDFSKAARYEVLSGGKFSEAKFRGSVVFNQPSRNLFVYAESLDARFSQVSSSSSGFTTEDIDLVSRIGKVSYVEAEQSVRVEHNLPSKGKRTVIGDKGEIDFTPTGNIITMTVDRSTDKRRWVMAREHTGLTLWSPKVEVRENEGLTRAFGPGELEIPGKTSSGLSRTPTRISFGERGGMIYNELALNIKVSDNIRILQPGSQGRWDRPNLDGRCDRLEIVLLEQAQDDFGWQGDTLSSISRMYANGRVLLKSYAEAPAGSPDLDWTLRPGTTFFTKGDSAVYEVPEGRIIMSSTSNIRPQLLLYMMDSGSTAKRQRLLADRFILNPDTTPKRWHFEGELESNSLRSEEPFDFTN